MTPPRLVADHQWAGRWLGADEVLARLDDNRSDVVRVAGSLVPGLRDHHVHLGLVDREALSRGSLSAVDDLGWIPDEVLRWKEARPAGCRVRVAGPFLTAPGGYPSGRTWAPDASVVPIDSAAEGAAIVAELAEAGVDLIKVALHSGMALLDDDVLHAIVTAAHARGLPVVVHAEGAGQAARAGAAGADALAHTPWTEALSDDLVRHMAATTAWISTLAIHPAGDRARAIATDNLVRFISAGGRVRYGTDMGNGPTPAGLNVEELEALVTAGLDHRAILGALCRTDPSEGWVTWTPLDPPAHTADLPAWCATLRRRPIANLEA